VAALGWALLLFAHFYRLGEFPGLHFDEAWAFNFSWRIAAEPGFWPLHAMSPYTSPWAHYWAAAWLHVLGPSVFVFRFSQVSLAVLGLVALCFALPKHARAWFPWCCVLLTGMVLNHRFAVELNGLHVLCFGALLLAIRERWYGLGCVFALVGTTGHILFYAVPLALLGAAALEARPLPRRARAWGSAFFVLSALFFARVLVEIPEKGKGAALLASALAACAFLALRLESLSLWRRAGWKALLGFGAMVFFANASYFALGSWTAAIYSGARLFPAWELARWLAVLALALFSLFRAAAPRRNLFLLLLLFSGLMMLKPAPRYFELSLLALAAIVSVCAHELKAAGVTSFVADLLLNAATVALAFGGDVADTDLRFLFYKDSSRDFLDKQALAGFLGGSGCAPDAIQTGDPRLKEELRALALGDWPTAPTTCPYASVARASEPGATGEPHGPFLLRRK
jgi:hypothetical protein